MRAVEIWGLDRSNLVRELPEAARARLTIVAKDACAAFEEAIELNGDRPEARMNLARQLTRAGDVAGASRANICFMILTYSFRRVTGSP